MTAPDDDDIEDIEAVLAFALTEARIASSASSGAKAQADAEAERTHNAWRRGLRERASQAHRRALGNVERHSLRAELWSALASKAREEIRREELQRLAVEGPPELRSIASERLRSIEESHA